MSTVKPELSDRKIFEETTKQVFLLARDAYLRGEIDAHKLLWEMVTLAFSIVAGKEELDLC